MEGTNSKRTSVKDGSVRNIRALLFSYVFSDAEALVDLYQCLGGNISAGDIEHLSLDDFLQRTGRYNDTAFKTKDNRLIVFVEHQSTKNKNMPFRFLEYAVDAIRILKTFDNQNKFGEKLMNFPRIEFYVAYNGAKELDESDKNLVIDFGAIQVSAQVVDIRFDSLSKEKATDTNNALAGYSYFAKVFTEMKQQGNSPYQAYDIAVEKSKKNGYLADIWSREECVNMFRETYTYDDQLREEGMEEGMEKGVELTLRVLNELRNNTPVQTIVEKYGVSIQQIEKMREAVLV